MSKKIIYPVGTFVCLLLLWELAARLWTIPTYILPSPSTIFSALVQNKKSLFGHSLVTFSEAAIGLLIATVLAFSIALLMDYSQGIHRSFYPLLVVSQTIPIMVLGPLFAIWFGFGLTPKVLMVILMCFFPIVVSFTDALGKADPKQLTLLKTYGASKRQIYTFFKIPAALTGLFSGLKVAATYCVGGAIVGEWLSADAGLGYYMIRAKNSYELDKVFAVVVLIIILSLLFNRFITLFEKIALRYLGRKQKWQKNKSM